MLDPERQRRLQRINRVNYHAAGCVLWAYGVAAVAALLVVGLIVWIFVAGGR